MRQLTTGNIIHNTDRERKLLPFLMRFAQDNVFEDTNDGKICRISETIMTRIHRETTDDS